MADTTDSLPSTPESVKTVAQTIEGDATTSKKAPKIFLYPGEQTAFVVGDGVGRAVEGRPYERQFDQPVFRPLKIFALDPSVSRLEGATAVVNVPYEPLHEGAIKKSRGVLSRAELLTDIARQLGQTGREYKSALRSAIEFTSKRDESSDENDPSKKDEIRLYDKNLDPHDLGSVLVFAVFEAFITVFRRKTERLVRLATNGSGRLPEGEIPIDLQAVLAEKASKLASQFLTICIRALDYCPPVDITLGEYLRAIITSDKDLVPDDPWAYREAFVDAFRHYHISNLG